jgi:hypothetical protein
MYTLPKYTSMIDAEPPEVEETSSSWGPPIPWALRVTRHSPVASVTFSNDEPPRIVTVTLELGTSNPHTGAGASCWITM